MLVHPRNRVAIALLFSLLLSAAVPVLAGDFVVGNLNPPTHALENYVTGNQAFAYLVYPPDQAACTGGGFIPEAVHMWLGFRSEQLPATFAASAQLLAAVYDTLTGQWLPGTLLCQGSPQTFTVTTPGLFELMLPFLPGECGPQVFNDYYFLVVRLETPLTADLPLDSFPEAGVAYQNDGQGWVDMNGLKRADSGKIIIWGDIVCTAAPVGNTTGTWGSIKGLYR